MSRIDPSLRKKLNADLGLESEEDEIEYDPKAERKKRKQAEEPTKADKKPKVDIPFHKVKGNIDNLSREEMLEMLDSLDDEADEETQILECRLYLYKPNHEVALELHKDRANIVMAGGGNRSGKTTTGIIDVMIRLTGIIPKALVNEYPKEKLFHPQHGRIVSTDFPNGIDKVIIPLFLGVRSWFPQSMIVSWDSKSRTMQIRNINGTISTIEFMSYDQDVEKFQGTSRHFILYDEEPPKSIRDECKMRVFDVDGQEIFCMTPTKGMSWTFDDLFERRGREVSFKIDTRLAKGKISDPVMLVGEPDTDIIIPDGDPDIHFFNFFSKHNPNINQDRVEKEAGKMGEEEKSMRMYGHYISFTGQVFNEYDEKIHMVKNVFEIPGDWPRYMALDPHPRTPHAILYIAVDSMGRKWAYDEIWTEKGCSYRKLAMVILKSEFYQVPENKLEFGDFSEDMVKIIQQNGILRLAEPIKFKRPWVVRRLIDPSALIENPATRTTLANDLISMGIGNFFPGSKDLSRGILQVKEALSVPEIFFFPHLTRTRFEFRRYVWADYTINPEKRNPQQKPKDKDDHMMENLRRLIVDDIRYVTREIYTEDLGEWRPH